MPPRRSARAAAANGPASADPASAKTPSTKVATKTNPLDGVVATLSGKFDEHDGHTQPSLEALIRSLGGSVAKSVTKATTHVVCSEHDYTSNAVKIAAGSAKNLPIVSPQWVIQCQEKAVALSTEDYEWAELTKAPATNGVNGSAKSNGKKRPLIVAKDQDASDNEPETKKVKGRAAKTEPKKEAKESQDETKAPEEEKTVAEGQFMKNKNAVIPLDEYCELPSYQVYVDSETNMIWDASLNQSNASRNNNKFYRLQVLKEPGKPVYKTWSRWGRVGEMGQHAILGDGSLDSALRNFEKKFKDKSGLRWEDRTNDPRPNKYAFVERSYDPDSSDEEEEDAEKADGKAGTVKKEVEDDDDIAIPECTLDKPVRELVELIFNQQYFQATMASLNYDANKLPLGKLSKTTISRGFQQLKDIAALMNDPSLAQSKWSMSPSQATEHLSNSYYSIVPHAFGRNRPPVIHDASILKKEVELMESLSDMKDAAEIMKQVDRKNTDPLHPLDRQYRGLNLQEMTPLDSAGNEYTMLEQYLQASKGSTHHLQYKVDQIFRIERQGEKARFDSSPYASVPSDRRLLWHGSRCTNYGGILSQGLRIAPPEAPVSGYMFGKGIYLADMSTKSANYCASYNSNGQALLLLCEAELGSPMLKLTNSDYRAGDTAKELGLQSTWGQGSEGPQKWVDADAIDYSLKGVKIPDPNGTFGATAVSNPSLVYNEYICYDVAQIKLRYLFRIKIS